MSTSRVALAFGLATGFVLPSAASANVGLGPISLPPPIVETDIAAAAVPSLEASAASDPMVGRINRARRRSGLRRLRVSPRLNRSSRRFGRYLMRADRFGHDSHIWGGGRYRSVGEVLAMHGGWRSRRTATIRGWMRSAGHRSVLLGGFRLVGVARVRGRFGSRRATIWVAQVAR